MHTARVTTLLLFSTHSVNSDGVLCRTATMTCITKNSKITIQWCMWILRYNDACEYYDTMIHVNITIQWYMWILRYNDTYEHYDTMIHVNITIQWYISLKGYKFNITMQWYISILRYNDTYQHYDTISYPDQLQCKDSLNCMKSLQKDVLR